jgi:hypothetical protein
MTPKVCADPRNEPRDEATWDALTDVAIIAKILQALAEGVAMDDGVEPAVVHWLGKRLNAAAEVLED